MNKTQMLLNFIIALLLGLISGYYDFPLWITLIILSIILLPMNLYPIINSLYLTKDHDKVEKFLIQRKKQPMYMFYYALANDNKEESEDALERLRSRYKQNPHWKAVFEVAYALHFHSLLSVKEKIGDIKQKDARDYYEALVSIEQGDSEAAIEAVNPMKKQWMKESILAAVAKKKGMREEARNHENAAIEHAKGIQRYILVKVQEHRG
ncbi:hypothetical protein FZW96_05020 [Bacillus sp. BGMRC 2118]|nr:hypothetical protein FZW96_05020 [Bacillus sp. BGMRC 2118]